jgi:hypothetical protein
MARTAADNARQFPDKNAIGQHGCKFYNSKRKVTQE